MMRLIVKFLLGMDLKYIPNIMIVCFIVYSYLLIPSVFAIETSKLHKEIVNKEKQLKTLKREIVEKRKNLEYNLKKEKTVLEGLEELNKTLSKKEDDLEEIENNLIKVKEKKLDVNIHIMELIKEKNRLSGLLEQRLTAMYKMKRTEILLPIFEVDSIGKFGRKYKYISTLVEHDTNLLKDYRENQVLLEAEMEKVKDFETEMFSFKDIVKQRKDEIEDEKGKRKTLLMNIRKKKSLQLAAIRENEDSSKELQRFIDKLKKDIGKRAIDNKSIGFVSMHGSLSMPVTGKIISMYGKVEHPDFKTITINNGIEIEAAVGKEVRSIYKGRVIYSGWFRGYGKVLIIDHGDGYYTLLGRLSKILKEVNSIVEQGDVVALVGDTGSIKGPHLYFEIRQHGMAVDPLSWLKVNNNLKNVVFPRED